MPYFKWTGITLDGMVYKGVKRAQSLADLDRQLLNEEIGLMNARLKKPWGLQAVSVGMQVHFFKHLAMLVDAGIYMDQALLTLAGQTNHVAFREIIEDMSAQVQQGVSIAQAMSTCQLFDAIVIQMIQAGYESGSLPQALDSISSFMESRHEFQKKLRQAALLPFVTFLVFIVVASAILVGIIPAISTFFTCAGKELPVLTRTILALSDFMRSTNGVSFLLGIGATIVLARLMIKKIFSTVSDRFFLMLPGFGSFIKTSTLCYYTQSLGLLFSGKVTTVAALKTARSSIGNKVLDAQLSKVEIRVQQGMSLHATFRETKLFDDDVCQMIAVAEKTGNVGRMMNKIASHYKDEMNKRLLLVTSLFQPALMIILALLIVGLILAVYMPLFDLSMVIT